MIWADAVEAYAEQDVNWDRSVVRTTMFVTLSMSPDAFKQLDMNKPVRLIQEQQ